MILEIPSYGKNRSVCGSARLSGNGYPSDCWGIDCNQCALADGNGINRQLIGMEPIKSYMEGKGYVLQEIT